MSSLDRPDDGGEKEMTLKLFRAAVALTALTSSAAVAVGAAPASAVGLTNCSVSVSDNPVYPTATADRSSTSTIEIDWSTTLLLPADFEFRILDGNGHSTTSITQSTATHVPPTMSWIQFLGDATGGTVLTLSAPLQIEIIVLSNSFFICGTTLTLMPNSAPSSPTDVSAEPGDASAVVSWSGTGGFDGLVYTATASPGGQTCTATHPATSCTVTGLTNGTSYTFVVASESSGGVSDDSVASLAVTPTAAEVPVDSTIPTETTAPTDTTAGGGDGGSGAEIPATGSGSTAPVTAVALVLLGAICVVMASRRRTA